MTFGLWALSTWLACLPRSLESILIVFLNAKLYYLKLLSRHGHLTLPTVFYTPICVSFAWSSCQKDMVHFLPQFPNTVLKSPFSFELPGISYNDTTKLIEDQGFLPCSYWVTRSKTKSFL